MNFIRSASILREMKINGRGFTGRKWQASETIAAIGNLSPEVVIHTNEALPVYFITGRATNNIPEKIDPVKNQIPQITKAIYKTYCTPLIVARVC